MENAARTKAALDLVAAAGEVRRLPRTSATDVVIVSPRAEVWDNETTQRIAMSIAEGLDAGAENAPRILIFSRPVELQIVDRQTAELTFGDVAGSA